MKLLFFGLFQWINQSLHKPARILALCLFSVFVSLVVNGSLFRLWSLHRDFGDLQGKAQQLHLQSQEMELKLSRASDPAFIEREAIERLDLVNEGDLVFVFTDEDYTQSE